MKFNIFDCHKKHWELLSHEKLKLDQEIYKKFVDTINSFNNDKYFLVYWSQENEPDTKNIIDYLFSAGKKVCLLYVHPNKSISYYAIETINFQYEYLWNMKMPSPTANEQITIDQIGCVVLPAIAFNERNEIAIYQSNQLFLQALENNKNVITIALGYKFSIYNDIKLPKKMDVNMVIHND